MSYAFYLGIDATNEPDTLTLALLEKERETNEDEATYHLRRIEHEGNGSLDREPAAIAAHVVSLIASKPYTGRTQIVVNETADLGEAILRQLTDRGLTPIGVTVTGSDAAAQEASGFARTSGDDEDALTSGFLVSEHALVEATQELYRSDQLKLSQEATEHASKLARGLQSYRARAHEAGDALQDIEGEPRRNAADAGYVLSTALACWLGEQQSFDPTEHLAGDPPPLRSHKRPELDLPAS